MANGPGRCRRIPAERPREPGWQARGEQGNAALELLILAPVIVTLIGLVIAAGRTSVAQSSVDAAARDAARQASISLTPSAAKQAAMATAYAALRADGLSCRPVLILDLAGGFGAPLGQPAQVSASVTCTVRLSDLLVPGVPGASTLTARFTSPIDPYRARAGGALSQRRHATAGTIGRQPP
jgi:Flp pilus assembly protein TadG